MKRFFTPLVYAMGVIWCVYPSAIYTQCPITVNAGADKFLCNASDSVVLNAGITGAIQRFSWSPGAGLSDANALQPSATQPGVYVLTALSLAPGVNLIINGDFEQGNTGFTTEYGYNPGFVNVPRFGTYEIAPTPSQTFPLCTDHSTGAGNFMIVDGSDVPDRSLWCQTVPVTPNTDYVFSFWVTSFHTVPPFANLEVTINGAAFGAITQPDVNCAWVQFSGIWNSGAATSADICIEDLIVAADYNDFGIDDISFTPLCSVSDTVQVMLAEVDAQTQPETYLPCAGGSVALDGTGSDTGAVVTYTWSTVGGNIVSGSNTLNPVVDAEGLYVLTVSDGVSGCSDTASTVVIAAVNSVVADIAPPDTLTCAVEEALLENTGSSGPEFVYAWSGPGVLSGGDSATATVNQPGAYTLIVRNSASGCADTAAVTVAADFQAPVADAGAGAHITCARPQVGLDGTASAPADEISFSWSGPLVLAGPMSSTPLVGAPGAYMLTVTNNTNGCTATTQTTVTIDTAAPPIFIDFPDKLTCKTSAVTLDASGSASGPDYALSWSGPGLTIGPNNLMIMVTLPGVYTLKITSAQNGCTSEESTEVQLDTLPPMVDAGQNASLHCNQTQIVLAGTAKPAVGTYQWGSLDGNIVLGANTANPLVDAPGVYALSFTGADNGCKATDSVLIAESAEPAFDWDALVPNCAEPNVAIWFIPLPGLSTPLTYSIDGGNTFQSDSIFINVPPGAYQLVMRDTYGCTATQSVVLTAPVPPVLQLQPVYNLQPGDTVVLIPVTFPPVSAIPGWTWTPAAGLSCADCPTPVLTATQSQTYQLTIVDNFGCTAAASTQILVDRTRRIYAPNVFSPDEDGFNDRFIIYGKGVAEIERLQIFDRWGSLVWEGNALAPGDENAGWDGRVRGVDASPGVFVWQARIRFADNLQEDFAGNVTIVR